MATSPSKRRKLDHGNKSSIDFANNDQNSESEGSSEDETEVPLEKSKAQRPARAQKDADSAMYAGGLYKSSMFKLQVDEMLAEVQPNYEKRFAGVDDALRRLKAKIDSIDPRDPLSISEARQFLHKSYKITAPYPNPKPADNAAYKLEYSRPSNINVIGSYVSRTMVKSDGPLAIDMVVVMPESIFQEKDYLNYRYFYKRAYYVACIAGGLQSQLGNDFEFSFEYLNGNDLQPILVVKPTSPKGESKISDFEIHVIPAAPQGFFAETKLRPNKNSIRPKEVTDSSTLEPTPYYNASLRADANALLYLRMFHAASKQSEGYKNACILGRIWLRQRGFGAFVQNGGFGHFEWSAITALLLEGGGPKGQSLLSPGYSSYQMFKAVLQFFSTTDLAAKPLLHKTSDFTATKSDSPMVYDGPRGQNLLYKMTPWSYEMLKEEAKTSLVMLNDAAFDQFESTFITRTAQTLHRFDCVIKVPIPSSITSTSGIHQPIMSKFGKKVYSVLREGLGNRVKLIDIQPPATKSWQIRSPVPDVVADEALLICVIFDSANIDRLVDHGPSAEEKKAAAKFQKFWGQKAELRRFKDGSILESLVWSPGTSYSVFKDIVAYVVKRHFGSDTSSNLTFVGEGFEKITNNQGQPQKAFEELRSAFRSLETTFRGLEGLPLQLRQLSPVSSQLRNASLMVPNFSLHSILNNPADVLIQFEGSGRWPDDIVAIQRTKIAFLLKIGSLLEEADTSIASRVGLEHEEQKLQNCAYLDVVYESGAAFRLRIQTDREQTLIERLIKDKTTANRTREEAIVALSEFKKTAVQLPLHAQSVTTHCTRFPLLGPSIRLFKTWLDKHMLLRHIGEELAELLCIRVFLQPYPWSPPSSAMTGFLRTLLFISKWDWRQVPLIVDFSGTMTSADVSAINTRLEAWRKIDPAMNRTVILAATNHDVTGTAFTTPGPSKMIAARLTALARSVCKLVKDQGIDLQPKSLFASSTTDYDFVLYFAPKFATNSQGEKTSKQKFKNLELQNSSNSNTVGFSPVQLFMAELEKLYGECVVFFHTESASQTIAGLWNPQKAVRPFKVTLGYASKPIEEEDTKVAIDKSSILAEIARLGGDMILKVEVKK